MNEGEWRIGVAAGCFLYNIRGGTNLWLKICVYSPRVN